MGVCDMPNNYSLQAREQKARRKGREAGYRVSKGFQHYHNGGIVSNWYGERFTGYDVVNLVTNSSIWGCYDANCDHLWTIDDVENFLKKVYEEHGLKY